jgi:hypothetical protein
MKSNKKYFFFSSVIICVVLFSSCDIINPPETIPARIQLNPVEFQIEPGQGTARQKITEVWVFANSSVLGAFTPPVEIHHLTDMPTSDFSFRGGIRNNGILEDAIIYPMFTTYDVELPTEPGALSVVTPIIRYKPEAVFSLIADFETQNDFVDNRDSIPESVVTRSPVDPYEGNFSGEIIMNATANFIEVGHAIAMTDLPTNGTPVYLEFHYKSEVEMSIGILGITLNGQSFSNFFYLLRPSESWNKIYIELTDLIEESDFPSYKILFRSLYPEGSTEPSYKIQIDNIKVVHL